MELPGNNSQIDTWNTSMFLYNSALKEIGTRIDILNDEFLNIHKYNPIEHVKSRIKTPESIVKKLKRNGYEVTIENMLRHINDIAGIRIICSFTSDIYRIADMIAGQSDINVLTIKDYIKEPKDNGYKSYHMIVSIPIFLSDKVVEAKVEIQIRTIAMDFWASLEHQIHYKTDFDGKDTLVDELRKCAETISQTDHEMMEIRSKMEKLIDVPSEEEILLARMRKLDIPIE